MSEKRKGTVVAFPSIVSQPLCSSLLSLLVLSCAAPTLGMPRLSGNRLGLVLTIPVFAIGYTAGLQKAMARHMGFIENGQPCIYGDGYKKDTDVPYFVRHEVSDRRL